MDTGASHFPALPTLPTLLPSNTHRGQCRTAVTAPGCHLMPCAFAHANGLPPHPPNKLLFISANLLCNFPLVCGAFPGPGGRHLLAPPGPPPAASAPCTHARLCSSSSSSVFYLFVHTSVSFTLVGVFPTFLHISTTNKYGIHNQKKIYTKIKGK